MSWQCTYVLIIQSAWDNVTTVFRWSGSEPRMRHYFLHLDVNCQRCDTNRYSLVWVNYEHSLDQVFCLWVEKLGYTVTLI